MTRRASTSRKPPRSAGHHPASRYVEEEPIPRIDVAGVASREAREGLTKKRHRETADLRALLADVVLEYTTLKRRDDIARGVDPRKAQEIIEEYDPVVQMALIGARSDIAVALSLSANSEVAQYLRPKLKSVEVISDPEKAKDAEARNQKAAQFLQLIDDMANAKRFAYDREREQSGVLLDRPDGSKS